MKHIIYFLCCALFASVVMLSLPSSSEAASAAELNAQTQATLSIFASKVTNGQKLLDRAKGILVLPKVYKAGIGVGAEYGEGVLRVNGKTVEYYNMMSASYGFQLGAQKKSLVMLFMDPKALEKFRTSAGWKVGLDASVALIKLGAEGSIDSKTLNQPILAFVIDQKGLMYDLSLEGAKFSRIKKK